MAAIVMQAPDGHPYEFPNQGAADAYEAEVTKRGGEVVRLQPAPPPAARPLYDLEMHLAALVDTADLVSPEQQEQFRAEFEAALTSTVAKRDRVGEFIAHCEGHAALARAEIARLQKRESIFIRAGDVLRDYVAGILVRLGRDSKGKWQKLEGLTHTFGLKSLPPHVEIQDEAAVPARYKSVVITMPAELWDELTDSLDLDLRAEVLHAAKRNESIRKTDVRAAIAEGVPNYLEKLKGAPAVFCASVPGATIAAGGTELVRS